MQDCFPSWCEAGATRGGGRGNKLQLPRTSYLGPALIKEMKDVPCDWIMRQNKFIEALEAESHLIPSAAGR